MEGQTTGPADERILFGGVIWCAECGAVCSHIQRTTKRSVNGTCQVEVQELCDWQSKKLQEQFYYRRAGKAGVCRSHQCSDTKQRSAPGTKAGGKAQPQYRVLERNLQHMKEEQERTETDLMKLLYERAEEQYRTLEVRDGEFRTEEIKNILAGKKELETFDENLYRKIIARIWVHGGNMAEVELINGSRVTAGYKD